MENENVKMTKFDKIKLCLNNRTRKTDIIWVSLLYIAGVTVHYLIGNFTKTISVLADELLYYSMAQSIHNGGGLMCLNAHTGFNKVMYPLVLSPLFGIEDPVSRVSMITLLNSALIMSSVFLVYLIGIELELKRKSMILAIAITLMFPDLMYSSSFMSENLDWPLVLSAIYLWLMNKRRGRVLFSALLGCLCYIGYLCKNTFLAFFLSYVLFESVYPIFAYLIFRKDAPDKKLREYYVKNDLIGCGAAIACFTVCCIAGNLLLFGGDTSTGGVISAGYKIFSDPYAFFYLLYAFVYYLAASLIAVLIMPIAYSMAGFKQMDGTTRNIFSFLILYLLISCAMVSYTIGIKEDIGTTLPRVHLRYIGFILLLLIIVFLKVLQDKTDKNALGNRGIFSLSAALLACIVMKGMKYEAVDQSMLNIYLMVEEKFQPLTYPKNDLVFYPASIAVFLILALIVFIVDYYKKKGSDNSLYIFAAFMLLVCFQNNRLEVSEYISDYSADPKMIGEITAADHYLDNVDDPKRILYIAGNSRSDCSKILTTYFNHTNDICHSAKENIGLSAGEDGIINVPETQFVTDFFSAVFTYDKFGGFDYIITDSDSDIELKGVTPIAEASGEFYTLFKNDDPTTVEIIQIPAPNIEKTTTV